MISMLIDDGRLVQEDGRWVVVGDLETISVPPGIHALLAARLERLDADERAVLGRAAVIGQIFYVGALEALASPALSGRIPSRAPRARPQGARPPGSVGLRRRRRVRVSSSPDPGCRLRSLSKESRADLHERFADWFEAKAGDRSAEYAEIVGWHLEQAHRYLSELGTLDERGSELARRAADRLAAAGWTASARGDVSAGVTLRSRALALMPQTPRAGRRCSPISATPSSGEGASTRRIVRSAKRSSSRIGQGTSALRIRARLSQLRLRFQVDPAADYEELEAEALAAATLCESNGDDFGAARAWRVVYWTRWGQCQLERMRPAAERAFEHDRRARDQHYPQDDLVGVLVSLVWGPTPASRGARAGGGDPRGCPGSPWRRGLRDVLPGPGSRDARPTRRRLAR